MSTDPVDHLKKAIANSVRAMMENDPAVSEDPVHRNDGEELRGGALAAGVADPRRSPDCARSRPHGLSSWRV
jgi:hypothetical protein